MSDIGTLTRAEIMEARDNDPLWPKPEAPPPRQAPERHCEICGVSIEGAHGRAKTCEKEDCKTELRRRRQRRAKAERDAAATSGDRTTSRSQSGTSEAASDAEVDQAPNDAATSDVVDDTAVDQVVDDSASAPDCADDNEDNRAAGDGGDSNGDGAAATLEQGDDGFRRAGQAEDDDWLQRIESAALDVAAACAVERLARKDRIVAQRRLVEAISEDLVASVGCPPLTEAG